MIIHLNRRTKAGECGAPRQLHPLLMKPAVLCASFTHSHASCTIYIALIIRAMCAPCVCGAQVNPELSSWIGSGLRDGMGMN